MRTSAPPDIAARSSFQHEAFVYRGEAEFVRGASAFIRDGLAAGEAVMVAVIQPKIDLLRADLHGDADRITFVDMADLGGNPARILPAWRRFADEHIGEARSLRGIGEPIWEGRRAAEIAESQLHEALLNRAFDGGPGFLLRCPYDAAALDESVVAAAQRSHPVLADTDGRWASLRYAGAEHASEAFTAALPEPDARPDNLFFGPDSLSDLREMVIRQASALHLEPDRCSALVLAVHEVATNSLQYGGEGGTLRIWHGGGALICEVRDSGHITEPLVGRALPPVSQERGRGLWLANHLCDLVQIRSAAGGTVVRLYMWL